MKNFYFRQIVALLIILSIFSFLPSSATAQGLLPFGGLVSYTLPCTCNGNMFIWFTPLWLGNMPTTGGLVYSPGTSLLYEGYLIGVPGAWHLGDYIPAAQSCLVVIPNGCIPLVAYGTINRTGTSVPGL